MTLTKIKVIKKDSMKEHKKQNTSKCRQINTWMPVILSDRGEANVYITAKVKGNIMLIRNMMPINLIEKKLIANM